MRVLRAYVQTFDGVKCDILNSLDTVRVVLNGKSLIRFGDGEFGVYEGKSIHYQQFSEKLKAEFELIKQTFEGEGVNCRFLLAVPKKYMQCSGLELGKKRVYISSWAESRLFFKNNFDRSLNYGDAFLFEKRNKEIYSKIWSQSYDRRVIIFVHNNEKYAEYFKNTYNRNVIFVKCPSFNAFESVDKILDKIEQKLHEESLGHKDVQIVVSAGPAGKIIVFRMASKGYHCIDAGHCWDNPLES